MTASDHLTETQRKNILKLEKPIYVACPILYLRKIQNFITIKNVRERSKIYCTLIMMVCSMRFVQKIYRKILRNTKIKSI